MRVLLVSQYYPPAWHYGGPVDKVKAIADGLAARGHFVTVVTSSASKPTLGDGPIDRRGEVRRQGNVTAYYLRSVFEHRGVTINPGVVRFCGHDLGGHDVVHAIGLYDFLATTLTSVARLMGVPYLIEPEGMYKPAVRGFVRKRLYQRLIGTSMLRHAESVIATSQAEYAQLQGALGLPPDRIAIRRNGVSLDVTGEPPVKGQFRARAGFRESDRMILFLGRLAPIKHLELLIESFAGLEGPDTHLLLVGPEVDSGYASRLKALVRTLGIADRTHFYGTVHGQAKAELLMDVDVVVLSSYSESFGIAIAEAVVSGTPVVVTEECGIAPHIRDRVGLVSKPSTEEFRAAMSRLLTDEALYLAFRRNCATVGREFSWDQPLDMLDELYGQVLERRRHNAEDSLPRVL